MAGEDQDYLGWVRARACVLAPLGCFGRVQAHHAGTDRGMGQRAHDDTAIPLCAHHHRAWHDLGQPFRAMTKDQRRAWALEQIERTRATHARGIDFDLGDVPF